MNLPRERVRVVRRLFGRSTVCCFVCFVFAFAGDRLLFFVFAPA